LDPGRARGEGCHQGNVKGAMAKNQGRQADLSIIGPRRNRAKRGGKPGIHRGRLGIPYGRANAIPGTKSGKSPK